MPLARCLGIDGAAPAEAGVRLGQPAFHATLPLVAIATDCDTLGKAQHRILLVLFHARAARQARRIVAYDARGRAAAPAMSGSTARANAHPSAISTTPSASSARAGVGQRVVTTQPGLPTISHSSSLQCGVIGAITTAWYSTHCLMSASSTPTCAVPAR